MRKMKIQKLKYTKNLQNFQRLMITLDQKNIYHKNTENNNSKIMMFIKNKLNKTKLFNNVMIKFLMINLL